MQDTKGSLVLDLAKSRGNAKRVINRFFDVID